MRSVFDFFGGAKPLCASQSLKVDVVMCVCVWSGSHPVSGSGSYPFVAVPVTSVARGNSFADSATSRGSTRFSQTQGTAWPPVLCNCCLCALVYDATWQRVGFCQRGLCTQFTATHTSRPPTPKCSTRSLPPCDPHFSGMCVLWPCVSWSHVVVGWGHVQVACEGRTGRRWPVSQAWVGPI